MPDNAQVIVDDISKTYFAPPYFTDNGITPPDTARYAKAVDIRGNGYHPYPECRDQGYFTQDSGPILWLLAEKVGLVEREQRWNEDGSWNW